jgi:hypothetical protein
MYCSLQKNLKNLFSFYNAMAQLYIKIGHIYGYILARLYGVRTPT